MWAIIPEHRVSSVDLDVIKRRLCPLLEVPQPDADLWRRCLSCCSADLCGRSVYLDDGGTALRICGGM